MLRDRPLVPAQAGSPPLVASTVRCEQRSRRAYGAWLLARIVPAAECETRCPGTGRGADRRGGCGIRYSTISERTTLIGSRTQASVAKSRWRTAAVVARNVMLPSLSRNGAGGVIS